MTENEAIKVLEKPSKHIRMVHKTKNEMEFYTFSSDLVEAFETAIQALEEIQQIKEIISDFPLDCGSPVEDVREIYRQFKEHVKIGTIEEFKALKEKNSKDFELLLKAVKESYPMFKGAYVELDVFMGDVMRRFTRDDL